MRAHRYQSLSDGIRAIVRVYGPLPREGVEYWLRIHRNQLPISEPHNGAVAACLDGLQERGEIEFRAGLWSGRPMKGNW